MYVKDSRGSGAIANLLILVLVFSSYGRIDRTPETGSFVTTTGTERLEELFSSEAEQSLYIFIDFDYNPILGCCGGSNPPSSLTLS